MTKEEIKKLANLYCGISEDIDFEFDFEERYYKGQSMVNQYNAFITSFHIAKEHSDKQNIELQLKLKNIKQIFSDSINDIEINIHSLGCGLEDSNIVDRYEAMRYGIEQMLEMCLRAIDETEL